jgi:hypothetical protein
MRHWFLRGSDFVWAALVGRSPFMGRRAFKKGFFALFCLLRVAVVREFLDVVHQTKQFPLRIDLLAPA